MLVSRSRSGRSRCASRAKPQGRGAALGGDMRRAANRGGRFGTNRRLPNDGQDRHACHAWRFVPAEDFCLARSIWTQPSQQVSSLTTDVAELVPALIAPPSCRIGPRCLCSLANHRGSNNRSPCPEALNQPAARHQRGDQIAGSGGLGQGAASAARHSDSRLRSEQRCRARHAALPLQTSAAAPCRAGL